MKEKLDIGKIRKEMLAELEQVKGALRAEIILLQANVEFMIDEIFELLLENSVLRRRNLNQKLEILNDLDWLPLDFVDDVKKLAEIRGWLAHNKTINGEITENIQQKFKQMKIIQNSDKDVFPERSSIQMIFKTICELYIAYFTMVYYQLYDWKEKSSLKNPLKIDNYHFSKKGETINFELDTLP